MHIPSTVVEIPKSLTAHQARDLRYYRRYNFESVAMVDYEIRDVMNRQVSVELFKRLTSGKYSSYTQRDCFNVWRILQADG